MKNKILFILHYSPPVHGASKVGDFIRKSETLQEQFECKFIKIKSSNTLGDIGRFGFKKFYYVFELYFKILFALMIFRPNKIYFTASSKGFAFFRDVLLCSTWKFLNKIDVFYHYHTKGVDDFISGSKLKLILTKFFIKNVNLILLSPMLEKDFFRVQTYKKVLFLPNGVENSIDDQEFDNMLENKFGNNVNVLYLSNMIKEKGYFDVLKLANSRKDIKFHFAGGWQYEKDEKEFFNYIKDNNLQDRVYFHGFVNGQEKHNLFKSAHLFLFPTKYKNEAFPLSILEALSYGIPVISYDEGSIASILNEDVGIISDSNLDKSFDIALLKLVNKESSEICRLRYKKLYTLEKFEENFIKVLV